MKNPNGLSRAGPSGSVVRVNDRGVSEIVGTVVLIAIVVSVVAAVVAVVVPQLRSLREQGMVEAAHAEMGRLGQRIVDLSRTGSPRSEQARVDLPAGRLDALRGRTCWATTATVPGPERLNLTLTGLGDGDARYGVAVHGADGVGPADGPSDLVVEASVWRGNQRRALADSHSFEVRAVPQNVSLRLERTDGTPVAPCSGRVRLRVVDAASGNVTGEAWVLSSGSLRWQAPLEGGLHAVEILLGGRVVETPPDTVRLEGLGAFGALGSSVTIDAVRLTVPEEVPATVGAGPVTVPLRGTGAFSLADGARGNATLAFHGAWNATLRAHVLDGTAFRVGPGRALMRPGPVTLSAVDRPVTLPEGLDAR